MPSASHENISVDSEEPKMTPNPEDIERAAEAICLWDGIDWNGYLGSRECSRDRYRAMATAALSSVYEANAIKAPDLIQGAANRLEFAISNRNFVCTESVAIALAYLKQIGLTSPVSNGTRGGEA